MSTDPNTVKVRGCGDCPLLAWVGIDHATPVCGVNPDTPQNEDIPRDSKGNVMIAIPASCPLWSGPWTVGIALPGVDT